MTLFSRISLTQAGTRGNSLPCGREGQQSAVLPRHLFASTTRASVLTSRRLMFFSHTPSESSQSYLCWTEPPPRCNPGPGTGLPERIQTFRTWKASGRAGRGRPDPHGCAGPSLGESSPTPYRRTGRFARPFSSGIIVRLVVRATTRWPAGRERAWGIPSNGEAVGRWSCPMLPPKKRSL